MANRVSQTNRPVVTAFPACSAMSVAFSAASLAVSFVLVATRKRNEQIHFQPQLSRLHLPFPMPSLTCSAPLPSLSFAFPAASATLFFAS